MDHPFSWNTAATGDSADGGGVITLFYRDRIVIGPTQVLVKLLYNTWAIG